MPFSLGKDSATALFLAARGGQLSCLMHLLAANAELLRQLAEQSELSLVLSVRCH